MEKNIDYYLNKITQNRIIRVIATLPKPEIEFKKAEVDILPNMARITYYTPTQVFHKTMDCDLSLLAHTLLKSFTQLHFFDEANEYMLKTTKRSGVLYNCVKANITPPTASQNRTKNYILPQGTFIPPLVDMGILTNSGRIVSKMGDKFRQINRFLEIIDDSLKEQKINRLNVVDFGCGKSYLTFVLYYYLTQIKKIDTFIIGLDLKADVIENCNQTALKYGYKNLHFEQGDISNYSTKMPVDMVISLHACDTATDFALFNAIKWGAKYIFSVPCCQHELNTQIYSPDLSIVTRYGVAQERICALFTDIIRCNLLEALSYKTQLLEFIDFEHTPKNLLIRATLSNITSNIRSARLKEVTDIIKQFHLFPKLYSLLKNDHLI
ncbi:MAG: SAM-dependent methyltransferase [Clostridia bacterium]|nr:SAM-dependent methyltransferase [Clostridia bacterium]